MHPLIPALLGTTLLTVVLTAMPAHAALLVQQAPDLVTPNAVANGTEPQAPVLAETVRPQATVRQVTWWGTAGSQFTVDLYANGDLSTPVVSIAQTVTGVPAGTVWVDDVERPAFAYTLDVGALTVDWLTVSVRETAIDAQFDTWYWLLSPQGDGELIVGLGEPGVGTSPFDLALRLDGDLPGAGVPVPSTLTLAVFTVLALRRRARARA